MLSLSFFLSPSVSRFMDQNQLWCDLWKLVIWGLCFTVFDLCDCAEDSSKWPKRVVDVGCGIGGSSRYLAKKYGAQCQGITLSPVQAQRAQALAVAEGLADKVCDLNIWSFSLFFIVELFDS